MIIVEEKMKPFIVLIMTLVISILILSCGDSGTDPSEDTGTIYIESDPDGAEIWLDSVNTGEVTPATIVTKADSHIVILKKEGYADYSEVVVVTADEQFDLTTPVLLKIGTLIIISDPPGATIWLNGINNGEITPSTFAVPDGNYTIVLRLTNYSDTTFVTKISDGNSMTVDITLRPI